MNELEGEAGVARPQWVSRKPACFHDWWGNTAARDRLDQCVGKETRSELQVVVNWARTYAEAYRMVLIVLRKPVRRAMVMAAFGNAFGLERVDPEDRRIATALLVVDEHVVR